MFLLTYLTVKDMAASMDFYKAFFGREPDIGNAQRFPVWNIGGASLALFNPAYDDALIRSGEDLSGHYDDAYLAFRREWAPTYGNSVVLNIFVEDLNAEHERIKALDIGPVSEIMYVNIVAPYYFFTLRDPDGNCLEITGGYGDGRST